jgi:hypothetical protein
MHPTFSTMTMFRQLTLLICGGLLVASMVATAQDAPGRWSIGAAMHTGAAYRTLVNTDGSDLVDMFIASRDERENPLLVHGGGLHSEYRLSTCFSIGTGLVYTQFGYSYTVDLSNLTFGDVIEPRRGFIYNTNDVLPATIRFVDRFNYAEVPIYLAMELGKGRWRSSTTLGVAPAFLIAARGATISTYADGRVERERYDQPEDFETFNLIPFVSTGISMHPGGRWHWYLRPTVRYGALLIIDTPLSARLFSVSADVGVRFTL